MISNTLAITDQLVADHGLKPDEYQRILDLIGREPTLTELGIFSAMRSFFRAGRQEPGVAPAFAKRPSIPRDAKTRAREPAN